MVTLLTHGIVFEYFDSRGLKRRMLDREPLKLPIKKRSKRVKKNRKTEKTTTEQKKVK